eukprot:1381642-Amphidinium_carterae.3
MKAAHFLLLVFSLVARAHPQSHHALTSSDLASGVTFIILEESLLIGSHPREQAILTADAGLVREYSKAIPQLTLLLTC